MQFGIAIEHAFDGAHEVALAHQDRHQEYAGATEAAQCLQNDSCLRLLRKG